MLGLNTKTPPLAPVKIGQVGGVLAIFTAVFGTQSLIFAGTINSDFKSFKSAGFKVELSIKSKLENIWVGSPQRRLASVSDLV
jgi:hypothetical protein